MDNKSPVQLIDGFVTQRLLVDHWAATLTKGTAKQQFAEELMPILSPRVLENLPPSLQVAQTQQAVAGWINDRAAESDVYLVRLRQSETLIGLLILVNFIEPEATPEVHLGYLFSETAWGKGYASELIDGLLQEAINSAPLTLIGGVAKANEASAHILKKRGFLPQANRSDGQAEGFALTLRNE